MAEDKPKKKPNMAFSNSVFTWTGWTQSFAFNGIDILPISKIKKREPQPDDFPDQVDYNEFMSLRNKKSGQPRHYALSGITSI